ncbi:hypothetical protein ACIRPE_08895 [Kitasatospora aureofaciens]|uniref:hypothetical protein n=1 Tax=Kitasatospora aureofaciens TaxID=1894 RepID=UPI0006A0D693|nr:hypothetical protein [Kitasatospora aureofaciens]
MVKLSGDAFTGEAGRGTAPVSLVHLTEEILAVHELGVPPGAMRAICQDRDIGTRISGRDPAGQLPAA